MKLSIVIPMYNRAQHIAETIHSVMMQSGGSFDYEVVIVDDGSEDNSVEICQDIAKGHSNIHVICQENSGPGAARNKGLAHAQGEYVWFLDSDDQIPANAFATLDRHLNEGYDAIVFAGANAVNGTLIRRNSYEGLEGLELTGQEFMERQIKGNLFTFKFRFSVSIPLTIFRRDFLVAHQLQMVARIYHEDFEFMPRAFFFMRRLLVLNDILYHVQLTPHSIVRSTNPKKSYDYLTAMRGLYAFTNEHHSALDRKLYIAMGVAFCNSLMEMWKVSQTPDKGLLEDIQTHGDIYYRALLRSRHLKFIVMGCMMRVSPKFLYYCFNKYIVKLN